MDNHIRLGLCCINNEMRNRKNPIFSSRTVRLSTIEKQGIDYVKELALKNIEDTKKILQENVRLGIYVFRISSEVFPHITNEKCGGYSLDFAKEALKELGDVARECNQRITAHPGQYNVLGSPTKKTIDNTIKSLNMQAEMFDLMGMDCDSVMTVHGGGIYDSKEKAINRWVENFGLLSKSAQQRLILENCEKCFNVKDCVEISFKIKEKYGFYLPVVVDSHHYDCYNLLHKDSPMTDIDDLIPCAIETWLDRGIRMKVHISEQGKGKIGHHSDIVEVIPRYFLDIYDIFGVEFDIMVEAKAKEVAVKHLESNYPNIFN